VHWHKVKVAFKFYQVKKVVDYKHSYRTYFWSWNRYHFMHVCHGCQWIY